MISDDCKTIEYYSDKHTQQFYQQLWGGDSIHIGIYKDDYQYKLNKPNIQKLNDIKTSADNKKMFIYDLITNYYNIHNNISIADFGSGYGGTSRFLFNKFIDDYSSINIDCYDISKENCIVAEAKNIKENIPINVFNVSFLNINLTKKYNIIYSEDAFIHINEREEIFKEINKHMLKNGLLIFSDIILTDNCDYKEIQEVYDRINIKNIETTESYINLAKKYNLKIIKEIEYKQSMLTHYQNILDLVENKKENEKIIKGLLSWIKHIKLNNITTKLFVFTYL